MSWQEYGGGRAAGWRGLVHAQRETARNHYKTERVWRVERGHANLTSSAPFITQPGEGT